MAASLRPNTLTITFDAKTEVAAELKKIAAAPAGTILVISKSHFAKPHETIPAIFKTLQANKNIQRLEVVDLEMKALEDDDEVVFDLTGIEAAPDSEKGQRDARVAATCDEIFKAMASNTTITSLYIPKARVLQPAYSFRALFDTYGFANTLQPTNTTLQELELPHLHFVEQPTEPAKQGTSMEFLIKEMARHLKTNSHLKKLDISDLHIVLVGDPNDEKYRERLDACHEDMHPEKTKVVCKRTYRNPTSKKYLTLKSAAYAAARAAAKAAHAQAATASAKPKTDDEDLAYRPVPSFDPAPAPAGGSAADIKAALQAAAPAKQPDAQPDFAAQGVAELLVAEFRVFVVGDLKDTFAKKPPKPVVIGLEENSELAGELKKMSVEVLKHMDALIKKDKALAPHISNFYNLIGKEKFKNLFAELQKDKSAAASDHKVQELQPHFFKPVTPRMLGDMFDTIFPARNIIFKDEKAIQQRNRDLLEKMSDWLIKAMEHESNQMTPNAAGFAQANEDANPTLLSGMMSLLRMIPQKENMRCLDVDATQRDVVREERYAKAIKDFDFDGLINAVGTVMSDLETAKKAKIQAKHGTAMVPGPVSQLEGNIKQLWMNLQLTIHGRIANAVAGAPALGKF